MMSMSNAQKNVILMYGLLYIRMIDDERRILLP